VLEISLSCDELCFTQWVYGVSVLLISVFVQNDVEFKKSWISRRLLCSVLRV
jgi:hypothetical protein